MFFEVVICRDVQIHQGNHEHHNIATHTASSMEETFYLPYFNYLIILQFFYPMKDEGKTAQRSPKYCKNKLVFILILIYICSPSPLPHSCISRYTPLFTSLFRKRWQSRVGICAAKTRYF